MKRYEQIPLIGKTKPLPRTMTPGNVYKGLMKSSDVFGPIFRLDAIIGPEEKKTLGQVYLTDMVEANKIMLNDSGEWVNKVFFYSNL